MGVTCSNQMKLLLGIMPLLIVFAFPILKIKIWFGVVSGFELFFSSHILAKVSCVFPMVSTLRITDQMTTRKTHPTLLSLPRNIKLECMEAINIEENKLPSAFDLSHCSKNWFPFFSEHSRSVHRRRKAGSTARNTWRSDDDKNSSYLKIILNCILLRRVLVRGSLSVLTGQLNPHPRLFVRQKTCFSLSCSQCDKNMLHQNWRK